MKHFAIRFIFFLFVLVFVAAEPGDLRPLMPLHINLAVKDNTKIVATINNFNENKLRVFKMGSFISKAPLRKAYVYMKSLTGEETPAIFRGISYKIDMTKLNRKSFKEIPAVGSIKVEFDLAHTYDLSMGGEFRVFMAGSVRLGDKRNNFMGNLAYDSDELTIKVDGFMAARTYAKYIRKRKYDKECPDDKAKALERGMNHCVRVARAAEEAALYGPAELMVEYFKGSDMETRGTVAGVFRNVTKECQEYPNMQPHHTCEDINQNCDDVTMAYYMAWENTIVFCNSFFKLPRLASDCSNNVEDRYHGEQVGIILHEMTHVPIVRGTYDFEFGYKAFSQKPKLMNSYNADTYEYFAKAVQLECPRGPTWQGNEALPPF